jgi:hypothetical protein
MCAVWNLELYLPIAAAMARQSPSPALWLPIAARPRSPAGGVYSPPPPFSLSVLSVLLAASCSALCARAALAALLPRAALLPWLP